MSGHAASDGEKSVPQQTSPTQESLKQQDPAVKQEQEYSSYPTAPANQESSEDKASTSNSSPCRDDPSVDAAYDASCSTPATFDTRSEAAGSGEEHAMSEEESPRLTRHGYSEFLFGQVNQTPFIHKLYSMLEDSRLDDVICWSPSEDSFYINANESFSKILCSYFKHTNIASFVRQLSMYGFHKVNLHSKRDAQLRARILKDSSRNPVHWEFRHINGLFHRNQFEDIRSIKRRPGRRVTKDQKVEQQVLIPKKRAADERRLSTNVPPIAVPQFVPQSPALPTEMPVPSAGFQGLQLNPFGMLYPSMPLMPPHPLPSRVPANGVPAPAVAPANPPPANGVPANVPPPAPSFSPANARAFNPASTASTAPASGSALPSLSQSTNTPQTSQRSDSLHSLSPPTVDSTALPNAPQHGPLFAVPQNNGYQYMQYNYIVPGEATKQAYARPDPGLDELKVRILEKQHELTEEISDIYQRLSSLNSRAAELGALVQLLASPAPQADASRLYAQVVPPPPYTSAGGMAPP